MLNSCYFILLFLTSSIYRETDITIAGRQLAATDGVRFLRQEGCGLPSGLVLFQDDFLRLAVGFSDDVETFVQGLAANTVSRIVRLLSVLLRLYAGDAADNLRYSPIEGGNFGVFAIADRHGLHPALLVVGVRGS